MKCSECEHALKGEELEAPQYRTGDTGTAEDVLCDTCFDESCLEFTCCLCCNLEHEAYQGRLGDLLFVAEPVPLEVRPARDVEPGVYEIVTHPYYGGSLLGDVFVVDGAVRRFADLPAKVHMDGYPAGHCCRSCAEGMKAKGATR